MLRSLIWLAAIVAALVVVGSAAAHDTSWYWNKGLAQSRLMDEGLQWDDAFDEVLVASCYPWGRWIPSNKNQYDRLWKHFRCKVTTTDFESDSYWISFHITGRYSWTFAFMRWA